jgi:hypothetical protein
VSDVPDDVVFKKSSFSQGGQCVQVAQVSEGHVVVGHSQAADGVHLHFTSAEWKAFVLGVKAGEFDF